MRPPRSSVLSLAAAGLALVTAACSDTTAPTSSLRAGSAALTIGPTPNAAGSVGVNFASDGGATGTTQYCGGTPGLYTIPATTTFGAALTCGTSFDLQGALAVYNPGWDQNLAGSEWIGPNATSNEYKTLPGRYVFQTSFTLAAGVTNVVLNDTLLSDNAVAVYLNGTLLEQQVIQDCPDPGSNCNWNTTNKFVISASSATLPGGGFVVGTNYITVLLVDTPNGGTAGNGYACLKLPQLAGSHGFTKDGLVPTSPDHVYAGFVPGGGLTPPAPGSTTLAQYAAAGCQNPTGLDFSGRVSWVVPPPPQICDFITFGRLVTTVNGEKVVISGNAGGNAPGGGILGEIEIDIGDTKYHVHTIDTYGLPTNAPLLGDPFARVITGKSGANNIELRLRDDPNPGQGEPTSEGDKVWLKINGVVVVPTQTPDQGNVQLHLNCRGPND